MEIMMLKSKIHRAKVTDANLNYVGSITIDSGVLEKSGMVEYQKVQVVNVNNGARIETYTIKGERGKGDICLNGAAARHFSKGDYVIIMAYCYCTEEEAMRMKPLVVFVDDTNKIKNIKRYEKHGELI